MQNRKTGVQEAPQYQCHKTVRALKIKQVVCHAHPDPDISIEAFAKTPEFSGAHLFPEDARFPLIPIDADWYRKHKPFPGGYYVVYEDGYASFSPAKAFEDGYNEIGGPRDAAHREVTTHRVNSCNEDIEILVMDEPGTGGANSEYQVSLKAGKFHNFTISSCGTGFLIPFQKGAIREAGTNGLTHEALLAILIDRLRCFQAGPFACNENMHALVKLTEAMHWLNARTRDRSARGVEGTHGRRPDEGHWATVSGAAPAETLPKT